MNIFDTPAKQPLLDKFVPSPYEAHLRAAAAVEGRTAGMEKALGAQKNIFKDLVNLKVDDPYADALKKELTQDVNDFYQKHSNLADPLAQREFYELEQKWAGDKRAVNLKRNYDNVTAAQTARKESMTKEGNQAYNFQKLDQTLNQFVKEGGTYGQGLDKEAIAFTDPGFTKYMSEKELREPFEATVNDMMASEVGWTNVNGKFIYEGSNKSRGEKQLRSALSSQERNLMGSLAGQNLLNKYTYQYSLDPKQAYDLAWKDMTDSIVTEYVYSGSTKHVSANPYGVADHEFNLQNPIVNLERQDETVNIKNPHGASYNDYTTKLGQFEKSIKDVEKEFLQRYMQLNGITGKTPEQFAPGFSFDKLGTPGGLALGNVTPELADRYRTQHAELYRQKQIANARLQNYEAKALQRMGFESKDDFKFGSKTHITNTVPDNNDIAFKSSGFTALGGFSDPSSAPKAEITNSQLRKALLKEDGYKLLNWDKGVSGNTATMNISIQTPRGVVSISQPVSPVYMSPTGSSGKSGTPGVDHYYALSGGLTSSESSGQHNETKFESIMDEYLAKDNVAVSGWSQTAIPKYEYQTGADGQTRLVIDEQGTKLMTKHVNDHFQNPANLRGMAFITGRSTDSKDAKAFSTVLEDELGADPGDSEFKWTDVKVGDVRVSRGPKIAGQAYFVVPVSYRGKDTEMKVTLDQIQDDNIRATMGGPQYQANMLWEEGRQYLINTDALLRPFEGHDIAFDYRNDEIRINGKSYPHSVGLTHIARNIEDGTLR
jgi:hypothetical protein